MRFLALFLILPLGLSAAGAADTAAPKPLSYSSKETKATGDPKLAPAPAAAPAAAPESLSPTAAEAPSEAGAVSPTAEAAAEADSEEEDLTPTAAVLDYAQAETRLLAKISEHVKSGDDKVLHNLEENTPAEEAGAGVAEVEVTALYAELAKRVDNDKEARQALTLAVVRGDKRAKLAKDLAYEDKQAASFIKRAENGDGGAKAELERLASKGNAKARLYLGLDKPAVPTATVPQSTTPSSRLP